MKPFIVAMMTFSLFSVAFGAEPKGIALRVSPLIGDGMVMQRDVPAPVWGQANPGEKVEVYFDEKSYSTVTGADGRWLIKLPPHPAGGPYWMSVSTSELSLSMQHVRVGDVWICSGQSNMGHNVEGSADGLREAANANDPDISYFDVPNIPSGAGIQDALRQVPPLEDLGGGMWHEATPTYAGNFSGVCYFFARELRRSVKVPIGLIHNSLSSSNIDAWLSASATQELKPVLDRPRGYSLSFAYNTRVAPLLQSPIKGVLWYQGENDARAPNNVEYRRWFPALIRDWRRAWEQGDFPFLFVQLPAYDGQWVGGKAHPDPDEWPLLRESQASALALPNTAQAVTIDTGSKGTTHPLDKQTVGKRLALAARKVAYGENIVYSGPAYREHSIAHGKVTIEFDHVGGGLVAKGFDTLKGFAIAGRNGKFVPATATIENNHVVVWSGKVREPTAVRYAWENYPDANLYNEEGLPAAPFRTDGPDRTRPAS